MPSVNDLLPLLRDTAKEIRIDWQGCCYPLDLDSSLMREAFGDYLVDRIACCEGICELRIASRPEKVG